jgi:hypothetical protein
MAEPNFENYGRTVQPLEIVLENLDRVRAERIYFDKVMPRLKESVRRKKQIRPIRQEKCSRLYRAAVSSGIDVDNVSEDTFAKREALRKIMGYRSLRGAISLDDARPEMIGEVYKKDFYSGEKHQ